MSAKLEADVMALIGQKSDELDNYSSFDKLDEQTQLTIASMLKDNDTYCQATIAVFLLGIGSFLTFMVTSSAPDYIKVVYEENTQYSDVLYWIVGIYNTANMIGLLIMLSPLGTYISIAIRLQSGFILTAIFTCFIPSIPYIFDQASFRIYMFIVFAGIISGISSAILCTSLFSFAAMLPNTYLITAVSGQSFAGILSAIIRIANKAAFSTNATGTLRSGIGCYVVAGVLQLLAAVMFTIAVRSQFVQQYMWKYWALRHSKYLFKSDNTPGGPAEERIDSSRFAPLSSHNYDYASHFHADFVDPASVDPASATYNNGITGGTASTTTTNTNPTASSAASNATSEDMEREIEMSIKTATTVHTVPSIDENDDNDGNKMGKNRNPTTNEIIEQYQALSKKHRNRSKSMKTMTPRTPGLFDKDGVSRTDVIRKIYKCLLSIFIGYGGTYLVFPSMVVGLELSDDELMRTNWSGVILYLVWSVFGWIGIYFAKKIKCGTNYETLWIYQLIWMFIMYGLFAAANEKWIQNDIYIFSLVSVTPLIFGFLSARTFAELPERVGIFETEIAQSITQITVLFGLLIGSYIAFAMNQLFISNDSTL